jgi:hypothetical protein
MIQAMKGMIRSPTTESTILPKAPPMITPTARSMTLPLMANSLNSLTMLMMPPSTVLGTARPVFLDPARDYRCNGGSL